MKIIPQSPAPSGSYWCSWRSQRFSISTSVFRARAIDEIKGPESLHYRSVREALSDEWLFDSPGLVSKYLDRIRGDVYVLLDDGWDIPYEHDGIKDYSAFGSMELNPKRFPYGQNAIERLAILSQKVNDLGYAGLGLWVPMQAIGESKDTPFSLAQFTAYWEEKAKWCQEAGIRYVKVDWGIHSHDLDYRAGFTSAFRQYAPDVTVEHAMCDGFYFNPLDADKVDYANQLTDVSDVYRLYDVAFSFNTATTLARAAELLTIHTDGCGNHCLINAGEEPYVAATLGCTIGMMGHPFILGTALSALPGKMENGLMQTNLLRSDFQIYSWYERALLWQRICPPVPLGSCPVTVSSSILSDSWTFDREPYPYYPSNPVIGATKVQSAPAAIARGTRLPEAMSDGPLPYLTAMRHPTANAYAIGMLARTIDGVMNITTPLASVTAYPEDPNLTIGIFGPCHQLDLVFNEPISHRQVYLGGMLAEEAEDVTSQVTFPEPHILRIPGELLNKTGYVGQHIDDYSDPASVLRLC